MFANSDFRKTVFILLCLVAVGVSLVFGSAVIVDHNSAAAFHDIPVNRVWSVNW